MVTDASFSPLHWHADYVTTYVERDVRQMVNVQDLTVFQRFIRLCAGRAGQLRGDGRRTQQGKDRLYRACPGRARGDPSMNKSPPGLASHYASISTLQIPQHWSDKQALAVWDLLDNIAGSVWDRYEFQLIELIQSERCEEDPNQLDLFDPDDPIPF